MPVFKYRDPETGEWVSVGGAKPLVPIYTETTMLASKWVDNKYSFESEYPHSQYDVEIEVAPTATVEQFEAFGEAMICGSAIENVATALNEAPTMDIPIIIEVVKK